MPFNKKNIKAKIKAKINRSVAAALLINIIEVFLIIAISVLFYINIPLSSTQVLFIPKGSTSSIVTYLNKKGYELNALDKAIIKFMGYPQSGWIDLQSNYMRKGDFLYKLTTSKAALKTITLIPGETSYFFLDELSKKFDLSYEKLATIYSKHAYKVDGNILAETYKLPFGMGEEHLLFYLFSYTNKKYEAISQKIFGEYNQKNWYKYVIIASIIQKEAASVKEMPIVSSVIYNRLKKKMALQMDGTLNYGKYSHTKVTSKMIRENTTNYNTYKNVGLPSHPICAVSIDAIKAAIFPATTEYLYFVKDERTGLHRFTKSYKTHVKNTNDYRKVKASKKKAITPSTQNKPSAPAKESSVFPSNKKKSSVKSLWNNIE